MCHAHSLSVTIVWNEVTGGRILHNKSLDFPFASTLKSFSLPGLDGSDNVRDGGQPPTPPSSGAPSDTWDEGGVRLRLGGL